ncbi:MAG: hypothetical protein ACOY0T_35835 [Myxococcota bacterium]
MTSRITTTGTSVATLPTAARTTATPARPFRQFMAATANVVIQGAQAAANRLPGGPLLAATVRTAPGVAINPAQSPEGPSSALGTGANPLLSTGMGGQAPGVEGVLAQGMDQNLYFLELQERISQESRSYSALSNVLKARHETLKNAIGNIR